MNAKMKISILCGVQLLIASINSDHEGVHDCNYIFDPYLIVPDTWSFGHDGYTNTVEWFFYWNEYPMNACWRGNGWDFPSTLSLRFQCVSEEDGGTETLVPKLMIFQNSTDCSGSEEATQIESWNVDIHHELSSTHFECDKERDCAYTQIVAYDSDTPSGPLPPGMYDMDSNPYYLEIDYPSDWDGWYNFGYDEECEHVGETFDTRFAISEGCTKVNYGYDEWYIITCSEERGIVEQTYSDHKCEGSPDWKYEWQKSGCHWGYLYEIDCGSAPIPIESVTGWDETHWTYDDYSYDPNSNYNHDDGMHLGGPDYAGSDSSEDWMHPQWSCSYIVNPRFESSSLNIWSEEDLYLYEAEWPIGACIPGNGLNVPREHSAMFQCANGGVSVRFIVYPNAECAEDKDIKIETVTGSATFQCNATPCSVCCIFHFSSNSSSATFVTTCCDCLSFVSSSCRWTSDHQRTKSIRRAII